METYLMISDITGRQYPHLITDKGIQIEGFTVTENDYRLDDIQSILEIKETIRIEKRIFRAKKIIEISIVQHPKGAQ
jgi:hypothetical protein